VNFESATIYSVLSIALLSIASGAQEPNPTASNMQQNEPQPEMRDGIAYYKVQVVDRNLPAIDYFHRSGSTHIGFEGTQLLPQAKGEAKVTSKSGRTEIDADFEHLVPANGFGPEYLTYVLWAITPEGRPVNLGEVLPTGSRDKSHITVTTNLQSFGLMVTAEPYFAVTMPSDLVVAQNVVLNSTSGVIKPVIAHFTLLPRGAYADTAGRHSVLHPITRGERTPLELYEAENAVMIADAAGGGKYAPESMASAKTDLTNAEDLNLHKSNSKETVTYAREAVQTAEDARIMTIRKMKAEDEAEQRAATLQAEQSAQVAEDQARRAKEAQQQAELAKQQADLQRQQEAAQRAQAEATTAQAQARAHQAQLAQQEAEQNAEQLKQQSEQMRERLRSQLNAVLQTQETARGLIMNLSDVLFDFNKYSLKPEAREKLAKISGILLAYPDLKVQVEGYTDNIGSDQYNQELSERRADSVRDYLVNQSVPGGNITAEGYGENDPIADNSTNGGRTQNRRVELVVSGASIGIQQEEPHVSASGSQQAPAQTVTPAKPSLPSSTIPH
jgi:outer membrane protein OmpA-like peptidoglycan-associated protein